MFMKGKVLTQGVEGDSRKARRATELSELNKEPEPAYLPLHLGHTGGILEVIKEEEEGVSAFAKSAFAVKKSAVPAAPPQAAMTSEKLLSGLLSAFPSPQRAMSCFLADLTSLDALSAVAQRAAVSAGKRLLWLYLYLELHVIITMYPFRLACVFDCTILFSTVIVTFFFYFPFIYTMLL